MRHSIYSPNLESELIIDETICENTSIGIERDGNYTETFLNPDQLEDLISVLQYVQNKKKSKKV